MRYLLPLILVVLIAALIWFAPMNRCDDDACRVAVAVDARNPALCAQVSEATQAWCYHDVAVARTDADICGAIVAADAAMFCRADVAVALDDLDACTALVGGARDNCLDAIARARNDGVLCAGIAVAEFRDGCAYDIGLATNSVESCLSMASVDRSYRCVTFVALQTDTVEPCAAIPQPDKDWCVASVAINLADLSLCEGIDEAGVYGACRRQILLGEQNANVTQQ